MTEQGVDEIVDVDDIVDRAISQKRSVKDILVEMRDTSELMVDLAYSALLTNSREIAEEVQKLEARMDDLQYEIEGMLLLSARTREDAADLAGITLIRNFESIEIDVEDIIQEGSTASDFGLQSGDQVFVPRDWWADNATWISFVFATTTLLLSVYVLFFTE